MTEMNMKELSRVRTIFHFSFMLNHLLETLRVVFVCQSEGNNQSRIENFTAAGSENIVSGGTQEEIYPFEIIAGESWPQHTSSK